MSGVEYIFFYTTMYSDEDVSREFGNNNTESRGIYGLLNIFPSYFSKFNSRLLSFERIKKTYSVAGIYQKWKRKTTKQAE